LKSDENYLIFTPSSSLTFTYYYTSSNLITETKLIIIIFWFLFYSDSNNQALNDSFVIQLKIHSNQKSLTVYGYGQTKKEAKIAAAKMALKNMKKVS